MPKKTVTVQSDVQKHLYAALEELTLCMGEVQARIAHDRAILEEMEKQSAVIDQLLWEYLGAEEDHEEEDMDPSLDWAWNRGVQ